MMRERRLHIAVWSGLALLATLAMTSTARAAMLTDSTGRQVHISAKPQRIVALTPSAVETLFAMEAGRAVVGRSASAVVFPPEAEPVPIVDSLEAIIKLRPDLIVSHPNHHRFTPPALEQLGIPLLLMQYRSAQEVLENITLLGRATGRAPQAQALRAALQERIGRLVADHLTSGPRVLLLFGTPRSFLVMGEKTYAGDLLWLAGGQNVTALLTLNRSEGGFHPLSLELIVENRPEWALVITHGDPVHVAEAYRKELEGNPAWWQIPAVTHGQVHVVPDDLFATSPGPRLDQALAYLRQLLSREPAHVR